MRPRSRLRRAIAVASLVAGIASASYAQRLWTGGPRYGGYNRMPPKLATMADFRGNWIYCRGFYNSRYREPGGSGWNTDYPGADNNFSVRLMELTTMHVPVDQNRQPNYVVVSLSDPTLFRCPVLMMEDVGTADFSDDEVRNLRQFFLKGGFLWVDDYWGSYAWENWVEQISRVLPAGEFPIIDIPLSHPVMHTLYDVKDYLQVPSLNFWYSNSQSTSERGRDSEQVHF
ncbi:MAG: DUF4159 domain-containing protein, partial [Vicinamibacterales bacterium]